MPKIQAEYRSNNVVYYGAFLASSYDFTTTYSTIKSSQTAEGRNAFVLHLDALRWRCALYSGILFLWVEIQANSISCYCALVSDWIVKPWNEADTTPHIYSVNVGSDISLPYLASLGLNYWSVYALYDNPQHCRRSV